MGRDAIKHSNLGRSVDTQPGARAVFAGGGLNPADVDVIDYINISSTGNAQDLVITETRRTHGTGASKTRAMVMGGFSSSGKARLAFIFASTGDATDYGDLELGARWNTAGASNATGNIDGWRNTISQYICK